MYENMTDEEIKKAIESHKKKMRENPNDANCSELWGPAVHYLRKELERRASK